MDLDQDQAAPRAYVAGPAKIRVVENGPARVAVEVTRESEGSKFVPTMRLAAGDAGNRVEFGNSIDWKDTRVQPKGHVPAHRLQPERDLQLGHRHHPASH